VLPAGAVPAVSPATVEYSSADSDAEARVFDSLAQRLPRLVPAGVVPLMVDTRKFIPDLSNFELAGKVNSQ
jgi:hypothetical protein